PVDHLRSSKAIASYAMGLYSGDIPIKPESLRGRRLLVDFDQLFAIEDAKAIGLSAPTKELAPTPDGLIHSLIERRARDIPDIIAVQFERYHRLSYRQLN